MRLIFDGRPLSQPVRRLGIGQYTAGLLAAVCSGRLAADMTVAGFADAREAMPDGVVFDQVPHLPGVVIGGWRPSLFTRVLRRQQRPALVHITGYSIESVAGLPAVYTVYDLHFLEAVHTGLKGRVKRQFYRAYLRRLRAARMLLAISEITAEAIRRQPELAGREVRVIYPVVNLIPVTPRPEYLLYFGNLAAHKQVEVLLNAYALLRRREQQAPRLCIAGTGPELGRLRQQAAALNIVAAVEFRGAVPEAEKAELYAGALLHVQPSRQEGFGMTIIEAQAAGVPCIVSDIPVFNEIAGNTVVPFPTADAPALADVLREVLRSPQRQETVRQRGYANAARFSPAAAAAALQEAYAAAEHAHA